MMLGLASCSKDIGNYSYHDVNVVSFQGFDTINGYSTYFGDTLKITPTLVSSKDDNKEDDYTYEWSFRIGTGQSGAGQAPDPLRDSVISTSKNLDVKIGLVPGTYSLQYRVTDKATGLVYPIRTNVLVTTEVYEGYLIMNDVNGAARLDMLSYNSTLNKFTQYTDVLQHMGSTVPMSGKPYQILCMNYTRSNIVAQNYGIFLLTSENTNRVNQETFAWNPTYNIRYLMLGDVPENFTAQSINGQYNNTNSSPTIYMYGNDNNWYSMATNAGYVFKYTPVNVYTTGGTPFKVSPYVATDGNAAIFYDAENRKFVTTTNPAVTSVIDVNPLLHYPTGYDLKWMNMNYYPEGGQVKKVYSILKDPTSSKLYLLRFKMGAALTDTALYYFQPFMPDMYNSSDKVDIANATNFTVSPDYEYLFYNVGSKVYEYDLGLSKNFLMKDYGNAQISYMSFLHIYDRYGLAQMTKNQNYFDWSSELTIATYNPGGAAGSNGTLEQYKIQPVNGALQLAAQWTGFGKIVSVGYRSR
ncbi:hypothetical protein A9P82_04775 [Arachidicoccus ginsenosidimutans]|nr:hypothetical protein A9P82_04775 [Arachidicoccus sp. BS20]